MKKSKVEAMLGKEVCLMFADDNIIFRGTLHKTGTEELKAVPGLFLRDNYYFVTKKPSIQENVWGGEFHHCHLFRSSHIIQMWQPSEKEGVSQHDAT